ncbi:MAG: phosphotransferase family protein [Novosphingobium sp.]
MSIAPAHLMDPDPMPRPDGIDIGWLNAVLGEHGIGEVTGLTVAPVGAGQIGETARLTLHYAPGASGPDTLIGKFASADPTSRAVARNWSLYEREVRFYDELAARAGLRTPGFFGARMDAEGSFVLLLEDLAPDAPGDQFRGLTASQMEQAVIEVARLHAAFRDADTDPALAWLDAGAIAQPFYQPDVLRSVWPGFRDRYADQLDEQHIRVCDVLAERYEAFARPLSSPRCVTHNDYRPDNMLLGADRLTVVDWQSVALGWGAVDVAYLIGGAYAPEARRAVEQDLLLAYHAELVRLGVEAYSFDELRQDYRRFTFAGINVAVGAAMLVKRTERGDRLFLTMLDRFVTHVLDHDALAILQAPVAG